MTMAAVAARPDREEREEPGELKDLTNGVAHGAESELSVGVPHAPGQDEHHPQAGAADVVHM